MRGPAFKGPKQQIHEARKHLAHTTVRYEKYYIRA